MPLAVPEGLPVHEYVAPVPPPEAVNTTFVFWHTVAAETRATVGVAGTGDTYAVTVEERVLEPHVLLATAVTDFVPVEEPLTV